MTTLRNRERSMEVDQLLFDPLTVLDNESGRASRMSVQLATRNRQINFRPGKTGHKLWLFQIKQIRDEARCDIDRMADRVSAQPEAACNSQLLEAIQSHTRLRVEHVGIAAVRRAQVNEFIDIIGATGQAQDRPDHQSCADRSYRQSIGTGGTINNVCRFPAGGAFYVLKH